MSLEQGSKKAVSSSIGILAVEDFEPIRQLICIELRNWSQHAILDETETFGLVLGSWRRQFDEGLKEFGGQVQSTSFIKSTVARQSRPTSNPERHRKSGHDSSPATIVELSLE
jgi:hypothetical protein